MKIHVHLFALLLPLALLTGCATDEEQIPPPVARDLAAVIEGGTLNALMTFNSTSYFIHRGEPMGFEYELLRAFAKEKELDLEVHITRDSSDIWPMLNRGEVDVAAARIYRTKAAEEQVAFTRPLYASPPAVVQRTGPPSEVDLPSVAEEALEIDKDADVSVRLISRPEDLAGLRVHVPRNSTLEDVLIELEDRVTGDIEIVAVRDVASVEPLIRRVVRGDIRLTASPADVAQLKAEYYQNIAVRPAIGPPLEVVWGVRRNAPQLKQALDEWIATNPELIAELYTKYFRERRGYRERVEDEYLTSETGRLSEFDPLFRKHARALGWDWRLLASQAYQESKFQPRAESWAGARGLLQLMPATAREVGVTRIWDPEQNVAGGVRYLQKLEKAWAPEIPDEEERLKFVLASYNAGRGHVLDAQRLAVKNGDDPQVWEDVAYWMLQKSKRSVYTDPVVRYGFVRGLEPVTYVELILSRFDHYEEFVTDEGVAAAAS